MKLLILVLMFAALLVTPVAAVTVSFDNATCGIHVQKDVQVNGGQIQINASDFPETNCSVLVTTDSFVTTTSYYNPSESKITYSEEYYKLTSDSNVVVDAMSEYTLSTGGHMNWEKATFIELRLQTILMEKQNELLEENNALLRGMQVKVGPPVTRFNIDPEAFMNHTEQPPAPTPETPCNKVVGYWANVRCEA
jgi:hypothetical protein